MAQRDPDTWQAPPRGEAAWWAVPLLAATAGLLGWVHVHRLRAAGATDDPQLAIAVIAAGACLVVAGWWLGGLVMLALAVVARRCHWTVLERWAGRLTPALVARTAAALVGVQLIAVAPAHADDAALDPFWGPPVTGTEQLSDEAGQGAASPTAAPGQTPTGAMGGPSGTAVPASGTVPAPAPSSPPARENPPARDRLTDGTVTVLSGDTLWDLTEDLLGPGATDDTVCRHLETWLEHNTLARNGDLIRPGDQLRVPPQLLRVSGSAQ